MKKTLKLFVFFLACLALALPIITHAEIVTAPSSGGGGGGSGTVTSVSVATANGFSGTVANPTTTPAITIIAGAITPTTVNGLTITTSTGTVTIANGKTLTVNNTLTFTGTDSSSVNFGAGGVVAYLTGGVLPVTSGGTGQSTIATARQSLAFPLISATQHSEGDSITVGDFASPLSLGYASLIATETYVSSFTNEGVVSQQGCDISDTQTFANEQPVETQNPTYTLLEGTNDAFAKGAGSYEAVYNGCMKAQLSWMTIPATYKVLGNSAGCVQTGTWAADSRYHAAGVTSSTNGSTLTCTITTFGSPLYAWYREVDSNGGTFTYAVDGGSTTSVSTATTPAIATQLGGTAGDNAIRVAGLAAGSHTIVFNVTSATSGSNTVDIIGTGTPSPTPQWQAPILIAGGVLFQQSDLQSVDTSAYNLDNKNNVAAADADGLNVLFVDVRKYVSSSSTDMVGLHPTTVGHRKLANGFEAVMQPTIIIPNPTLNSLSVTGPGTNAFGSASVLIQTSSSEAGIHINNTGTNGREYGIYATSNGSGLGAGLFGIIDATAGAIDLSFNSTGIATFLRGVFANGLISNGTKFTLTTNGCAGTTTIGGATAGHFLSGTTGTCTVTITLGGLTATNGWNCGNISDITTIPALFTGLMHVTSYTATTCTVSGTTVSGDEIDFTAMGY